MEIQNTTTTIVHDDIIIVVLKELLLKSFDMKEQNILCCVFAVIRQLSNNMKCLILSMSRDSAIQKNTAGHTPCNIYTLYVTSISV